MAKETSENVANAGKKSPVMLIVVLVNVVLALGIGGYIFMSSQDASGAAGDGAAVGGVVSPAEFVSSEMQPFILNLVDEDGNRYLKLTMVVRLRSDEARDRFGTLKPAVRDRFIEHISSLSVQDLTSPEKKRALKKVLVERANEVVPRGDVADVYFTDFVIQ